MTSFAVVSTNTLDHHAQTLCSDLAGIRGVENKVCAERRMCTIMLNMGSNQSSSLYIVLVV